MIIFLIALLAISAVAFIAFLFSKSKSKKRNLLLSGIVAVASIVAIGVVNAQSDNEQVANNEPKTEDSSKSKTDEQKDNSSKNEDIDTKKNTSENSDSKSDSTNQNNVNNNNNQSNNTPTYRAATYELDKAIATTTTGIGNQTMTIDAYNSLTINQLTLQQTLATYGTPDYTSGGTEGSSVMDVVYKTDQTSYSVDLQFKKAASGTWLLSSKNSLKTTGITYPAYTRQ